MGDQLNEEWQGLKWLQCSELDDRIPGMTNMSIAVGLLCGVVASILTCLAVLFSRVSELRRQNRRLESRIMSLEDRSHRRAQVASTRTTFKSPGVDSRAVTTKRDTSDIPARGARMVQGVKRVRSDDDRQHHDGELQ